MESFFAHSRRRPSTCKQYSLCTRNRLKAMHCEASSAATEVGQFWRNSLAPAYCVIYRETRERERERKRAKVQSHAHHPEEIFFLNGSLTHLYLYRIVLCVQVCKYAPAQSFIMEEVRILCGYIVNNKFYDGKKKIYLRVIDIHFICSRELFQFRSIFNLFTSQFMP